MVTCIRKKVGLVFDASVLRKIILDHHENSARRFHHDPAAYAILPADALIIGWPIHCRRMRPNDINHHCGILMGADCVVNSGSLLTDNYHVAALDDFLRRGDHQGGNVGYCLFDITLICSYQLCESDFLIVNDHFVTLADQRLNQHHNRTFAHVVRTRFKTESQHSDSILADATDQVESYFNLFQVGPKHSVEHGQFQIELLRFVKNGTKVLGQARTTESESRFKIIRRYVQLGIFAENLHYSVSIDTHTLTKIPDLIREAYFNCVKRVTGIFDQLSYGNGRSLHRS